MQCLQNLCPRGFESMMGDTADYISCFTWYGLLTYLLKQDKHIGHLRYCGSSSRNTSSRDPLLRPPKSS